MIKQGHCTECHKIFDYNANDRQGKFCSQKCHYKSKQESALCSQCGVNFIRRKKEPRKTCSDICFGISRGVRSKSPEIQEMFKYLRNERGGQSSLLDRFFLKVRRVLGLFNEDNR